MGKAIIQSHLGEGQYQIKVQFDNVRVEARKTYLTAGISESTTKITDLNSELSTAFSEYLLAKTNLDDYINGHDNVWMAENPSELSALTKILYEKRTTYDVINGKIKAEKLRKLSMEKEKAELIKYCPEEITATAWCVENNTTLGLGIPTKTIEVDYLIKRDTSTNQIKDDTGFWLPATVVAPESVLQHPYEASVHSNWFNLAVAPAGQRYKGRYRVATITSLDKNADTCNLTFDGQYDVFEYTNKYIDELPILPQFIGAQQLNYTGANIIYGLCNAEAFEVGDKVIVDLHSGVGAPTVIGFHDHPRACPEIPPSDYYVYWIPEYYPVGAPIYSFTEIEIDGMPYVELRYFFKWSLQSSICSSMGLTYPHYILELLSFYAGTFQGHGYYYTPQMSFTRADNGSVDILFYVNKTGSFPPGYPEPVLENDTTTISFEGGFSHGGNNYDVVGYGSYSGQPNGRIKVHVT